MASALYFLVVLDPTTPLQSLATTEEWDGSSWTEVADLSTGRKFLRWNMDLQF